MRVLHLEDSLLDAELIKSKVRSQWPNADFVRVDNGPGFTTALTGGAFDLILSDFSMPGYSGLQALGLAREHRPATPFLFLSGTIGEDNAVEALKQGATDYVLKDRMSRLLPAIQRALDECQERSRRVQAEKLIRQQAELLDVAQDAIIVRDLDDHITFWNKGAERIYGWAAAEVLGQSYRKLFFPDPENFDAAMRQLVQQGTWKAEMVQSAKDGRAITVDSSWTLVRTDAERLHSVLVINTDVTERKELESRFLRAQRLESIGTLAGGIAHDLNNLLSPILMGVELLKQLESSAGSQPVIAVIEQSAKRGAELVKQVLSFSRGMEGARVPVQLSHVVHEIEGLVQHTLPRNITFETYLPRDLWAVTGDASQINQVLMNLCVNARDAMPKGGRLSLIGRNLDLDEQTVSNHHVLPAGRYVNLEVADTGTGMSPAIIDRIFEPFYTTKELGKGTGLGLSTVLGIVRSHGGMVTVASEPGKGSAFQIYFPADKDTRIEVATHERCAELPRGRGETILLVDDEAPIRNLTKDTLEMFGYQVITAEDGAEAIGLYALQLTEIAAVVTDVMMPVMDGPALISAVKRINPKARIIAATGLPDCDLMSRATELGIDYFLAKPCSAETLLVALSKILASPAAS